MTELAEYLADNYGECLAEPCACRRRCHDQSVEWPGRFCPHWKSTGARTFEELRVLCYVNQQL